MSCVVPLQQLWADNFLVYFKAHSMHFNVEGDSFVSDHAMFSEVYEYLYTEHDRIGEQIRQFDKPVLVSLKSMIAASSIDELSVKTCTNTAMFSNLVEDLGQLMATAQSVYELAGKDKGGGLENLLGEYIMNVSKLKWKLKAILGKSIK